MQVSVVDDSSTMRRIIVSTPEQLGHTDVVAAGNGREGLGRRVDLEITHWNMPKMSGIELIQALRPDTSYVKRFTPGAMTEKLTTVPRGAA